MIAKCYIKNEDDKDNILYFDTRMLVVRAGGVSHRYALTSKITLNIAHKKLMLPILAGGLVGCFTIIAIWQNLFNPLFILLLFLAAMGAFYYGWMGNYFLETTQYKTTLNLPIPKNGQNLHRFIEFFHHYQQNMQPMPVYHVATKSHWESQLHHTRYTHPSLAADGFIHAATPDQLPKVLSQYFPPEQEVVILELDTLVLGSPMKYEAAANGSQLYPHVYGKIDIRAIKKSYPILAGDFSADLLSRI